MKWNFLLNKFLLLNIVYIIYLRWSLLRNNYGLLLIFIEESMFTNNRKINLEVHTTLERCRHHFMTF